MTNYVFPSDLTSRQQGHFMKIVVFPSSVGSAPNDNITIMLFIPGGPQNGPMNWAMVHEYDDVKLTKLGTGAIGAITRVLDVGAGAARLAGQGTINPKVDVLYGNSELRQFTFSFFMAPQSKKESEELKMIIKTLRKYSAPEIGVPTSVRADVNAAISAVGNLAGQPGLFAGASGQGSQLKSGLWFVPPAEFLISFHSIANNAAPENEYLPKIGRCVLERIDVDFSPGQNEFSTFNDGAPTNVQLTMIFREMRIISQTDIDNGY